ncbi:MAG: GNAT family N-acetyltransferase, partial [Chloroflexi bacterium]|nr:GNAT family N-acetyltransferase [Chloroflexota bacterium]
MIETPLFESRTLRLTEVDLEQDPAVEAAWTQDLDYVRWFRQEPPRPLASFEIKKYYQKLLKPDGEDSAVFHFAVRLKQDERLIGFVRVANIVWNNGVGSIEMAVGDPALHGRCEEEMLTLILKYAFHELNLFRLSLTVPEYDSV